MPDLRETEKQIEQIKGLRDIVTSMKTLASTYLKRAEGQLESVRLYHDTILRSMRAELLQMSAQERRGAGAAGRGVRTGPHGIILFSTEQGLCGRFNEIMLDETRKRLDEHRGARLVVLGHRGESLADAHGLEIAYSASSPTSPEGIDRAMRSAVEDVYGLYDRERWGGLHFLYAVHESIGRFDVNFDRVLPLDAERFLEKGDAMFSRAGREEEAEAEKRKAERAAYPGRYMSRDALMAALVQEYFYIEFYRAFVETVAAENSMRLQSMEAAKANIDDTLEQLERLRRILRQDQITGELLDVISGAEAVRG